MKILHRNNSKIWFVVAVEGEFALNNANIAYSGIGKINAAMTTQYIIDKFAPELIVNVGTAGSSVYDFGTILSVNQFVQRDMNTTEFMAPKFVCPQTNDAPILEYGEVDARFLRGISGTGDTFVRNIACDIWDCVGMEDFAIAWVCRENNIPLRCYKFVSDGKSGDTSDREWADVLIQARGALEKIGNEILGGKNV